METAEKSIYSKVSLEIGNNNELCNNAVFVHKYDLQSTI